MKHTDAAVQLLEQMIEDGIEFTQVRAYTGDVLFTEKMAGTQVFLVKDGQVDLFLMRDERRVVVESLTKGQCFGMNSSLLNKSRGANAMAATYSEFYVIDSAALEAYMEATPKTIRSFLSSLASRIGVMSELVATRINFNSELLVYAELLQIMGFAELGARRADARAASDKKVVASVVLTDVFARARAILGQADPHIRHILGKLLNLHLIRIEDDGNGKRVYFSPNDIVVQARKHTGTDKEKARVDYEYVTVNEFAQMVEVDRGLLLSKLARSEFSEDIFTFRKSEVVRLLDTKGRKFFSERKIKQPDEFVDIEDIEFADGKTVVEVLSAVDSFDLAKLLSRMEAGAAKDKVLANLPRAKRTEVESDMQGLKNVDAIEVSQIGQRIIGRVKERMLNRG